MSAPINARSVAELTSRYDHSTLSGESKPGEYGIETGTALSTRSTSECSLGFDLNNDD